ncbi:multicopy suppressor of BFA (Brefeldin A) [Diplodia intermedia]|uniref:Multicopy suppressor of BFA (Brefeldin A) n=1 Tax=Diplodia intermedia TaxID=856260 RepID=A0ABR3THV0_9PEZI
MADTAAPAAAKKQQFVKPEKPSEDAYKTGLAEKEKQHAAAQDKLKALNAKIDLATPNNKDSPTAKKQQELRAELAEIRKKQQANKGSRNTVFEQIKKLDEQLKSRIQENKTARSRVNFKNADEVDREIARLQSQVDSGSMKIVEEKKALADISSLNKQKKNFAGFDQAEKGIADLKAKIAELRKSLDDPEAKAMSDRYSTIQSELDAIKGEQDEAYKSLNSLRDERTKLRNEQQAKWTELKEFKDKYFEQKRAFRNYEQEAYKVRRERQDAERKAYEAKKRREIADAKLEEASAPAYTEEIVTAEGLIRYFDPSALPAKETNGTSKFAAQAGRSTDDSAFKGMKVVKKEEEDYFAGSGSGKKGKKNKKNKEGAAASSGFNLSIGVIEQLAQINVEAPASQSDIPGVVEKLKEKLETWKKDQSRKTQENIDKAKKEIEKLDAAESDGADAGAKDTAKKPAAKNQQVNGSADAGAELTQEKDAVTDAAKDLEKASIEDKDQTATA